MFVSSFAVLALALSAVAAPLAVPQNVTDPHTRRPDLTKTTNTPAKGAATNLNGLPTITSPHETDVWTAGQQYPVTWSKHHLCHSLYGVD
jgi:hypothetical protein